MSLAEAVRPSAPRPNSPASLPAARPPLRLRRVPPRDDLSASVGDAAALAVMIGLGETYFAAFALALGTGETFAGLVATLPMLAGATMQLATPRLLAKQRSYKKWVVACVSLQAASLLLMPLAAFFSGSLAAICIFIAAAFYWAGSQASGPAWNTWVEEIIPRRLRARFLAFRARISQACTLAGFAFGGLALQAGKSHGWLVAAFAGIFLIGSSCRFLSAWFLNRHSEPSRGRYSLRQVPPREVFFRSRKTGGGTPIVLYLLAMQAAVQISGPYFAPYMLAQRDMSYLSYMVLVGIGYLGKVLALPLWGQVAHRAGARRLLWIGGTSIVPVAALWLGSDFFANWQLDQPSFGSFSIPFTCSAEFIYIGLIQLISGIVWAAYELAMLLMFFEAIPKHDRASVMTYYNFGNAAAHVVGGLIGAAILQIGNECHAAYLAVFGISSLMRLCTVPLLRSVNSQSATASPRSLVGPSVALRETPEPV